MLNAKNLHTGTLHVAEWISAESLVFSLGHSAKKLKIVLPREKKWIIKKKFGSNYGFIKIEIITFM